MLRLSTPVFTRPVVVAVPAGDGVAEESFRATFRMVPARQATPELLGTEAGSLEFLRAAIVSLDDLAGENGAPLPYSEEVREAVFDRTDIRLALIQTYFAHVNGVAALNRQ